MSGYKVRPRSVVKFRTKDNKPRFRVSPGSTEGWNEGWNTRSREAKLIQGVEMKLCQQRSDVPIQYLWDYSSPSTSRCFLAFIKAKSFSRGAIACDRPQSGSKWATPGTRKPGVPTSHPRAVLQMLPVIQTMSGSCYGKLWSQITSRSTHTWRNHSVTSLGPCKQPETTFGGGSF